MKEKLVPSLIRGKWRNIKYFLPDPGQVKVLLSLGFRFYHRIPGSSFIRSIVPGFFNVHNQF